MTTTGQLAAATSAPRLSVDLRGEETSTGHRLTMVTPSRPGGSGFGIRDLRFPDPGPASPECPAIVLQCPMCGCPRPSRHVCRCRAGARAHFPHRRRRRLAGRRQAAGCSSGRPSAPTTPRRAPRRGRGARDVRADVSPAARDQRRRRRPSAGSRGGRRRHGGCAAVVRAGGRGDRGDEDDGRRRPDRLRDRRHAAGLGRPASELPPNSSQAAKRGSCRGRARPAPRVRPARRSRGRPHRDRGRRAGILPAERLGRPAAGLRGGDGCRSRMPTRVADVAISLPGRRPPVAPTRSAFDVAAPSGQPLLTAPWTPRRPARPARRWRRATWSLSLWCSPAPSRSWPGRCSTGGTAPGARRDYAPPPCSIAAVIVSARVIARAASPADWAERRCSPGPITPGTLFGPLLSVAVRLPPHRCAAGGLVALLLFTVEAWRAAAGATVVR